jgi:hypothetical protein
MTVTARRPRLTSHVCCVVLCVRVLCACVHKDVAAECVIVNKIQHAHQHGLLQQHEAHPEHSATLFEFLNANCSKLDDRRDLKEASDSIIKQH